ncbi:hypothetical protein [Yoonia maritima]|uniref:hypothetical protein n=1 Tax=Yoonia maritima TaxID=1435347 RepID=UPI003736C3D7
MSRIRNANLAGGSLFVLNALMPAGHPPIRAHPAKPFRTLRDAAVSGEVVLIRCGLCRRGATFLASDLIQVVDPMHPVHLPPFGCSKCGTTEYIDIRMATPQSKDVGLMPVRRLVGSKKVWLWQDKVLGE